jgi:hypothetical protein
LIIAMNIGQVLHDRVGLPEHEIAIDQYGCLRVRVDAYELRCLKARRKFVMNRWGGCRTRGDLARDAGTR